MIKIHEKVFANSIKQLQRDLSQESLTLVVNLAAIALCILYGKRLQVGQSVTALPLEGTRLYLTLGCME